MSNNFLSGEAAFRAMLAINKQLKDDYDQALARLNSLEQDLAKERARHQTQIDVMHLQLTKAKAALEDVKTDAEETGLSLEGRDLRITLDIIIDKIAKTQKELASE